METKYLWEGYGFLDVPQKAVYEGYVETKDLWEGYGFRDMPQNNVSEGRMETKNITTLSIYIFKPLLFERMMSVPTGSSGKRTPKESARRFLSRRMNSLCC